MIIYKIIYMKNLFLTKLFFLLLFFSGCQTIEDKSKKENEELSKFIGQPETELKIVMGKPDSETKDSKGSKILIYKSKKYNILCERKFEIDQSKMVIGVSSRGCF